jgi:hypothetical protein
MDGLEPLEQMQEWAYLLNVRALFSVKHLQIPTAYEQVDSAVKSSSTSFENQ